MRAARDEQMWGWDAVSDANSPIFPPIPVTGIWANANGRPRPSKVVFLCFDNGLSKASDLGEHLRLEAIRTPSPPVYLSIRRFFRTAKTLAKQCFRQRPLLARKADIRPKSPSIYRNIDRPVG
jgi:hypothetical protein